MLAVVRDWMLTWASSRARVLGTGADRGVNGGVDDEVGAARTTVAVWWISRRRRIGTAAEMGCWTCCC